LVLGLWLGFSFRGWFSTARAALEDYRGPFGISFWLAVYAKSVEVINKVSNKNK